MEKAFVSVLIPAYNHEKYVQETVGSIINQTHKNIELLIVNDGSNDDTWQKICEMRGVCEKRFVRVDFETQTNLGTCETLNKLIDKAEGKYIYHIASDDLAKPNAIEVQSGFLEDNPEYAQVMGDNEIIDGNSKRVFWDKNRNNVSDIKAAKYKTFGDFLKNERKDVDFNSEIFGSYGTLLDGNYIPNGQMLLRQAIIEAGKYNKNAPLEDWYMNLQIAKKYKVKYLDEILFSYRWHSANSIQNTDKMKIYGDKTLQYEICNAKKSKNEIVFKALYEGDLCFRINIFGICSFEKYRSFFFSKKFLKFFNRYSFLISKKLKQKELYYL